MSRSASFVIAIIMYFKKMNFQDAYNFVLHKRKIICPNYGFIEQLIEFQEMLELINYDFKFLHSMHNIIFEDDDF
jgi:protein-tyrosine phosphatase